MTALDLEQDPFVNSSFPESGAVLEIRFLLEPTLLERLEEAADEQGMAAVSLIRRILREFLHHPADGPRIP